MGIFTNTKQKKKSVIPGFGLTMGFTLLYLSIIVLIPLSMLFLKSFSMGFSDFLATVTEARVVASYKISFLTALSAALINCIFGILIAWVLTKYQFPFKKVMDGLVDLPFALPTAVAGITLTALYSTNGWFGQFVSFKIAYTPIGITIALVFIGIPFVARMVQPVLENIEKEVEEASASLGATRWQTFTKVILPELMPAILTGFALSFARALGEYGSVVFISGNMPFKTEISPLIIMTKLEQYDYEGATAVAVVLLICTFIILFFINFLQYRYSKKFAK